MLYFLSQKNGFYRSANLLIKPKNKNINGICILFRNKQPAHLEAIHVPEITQKKTAIKRNHNAPVVPYGCNHNGEVPFSRALQPAKVG